MASFYLDNDDLRFYVERGLEWGPLVELVEDRYRAPDGFKDLASAVEFYKDTLSMIGELAAEEIAPRSAEIDRVGVHMKDGEVVEPEAMTYVFERLKLLELHGMCIPREFGGMNCPLLISMITSELFARGDISVMAHHSFHGGMAVAMLLYSIGEGSTIYDKERSTFTKTRFEKEIREIVSGQAFGSMDITEPNAGSDMGALRAKGELDADGRWTVSGQKIFITSGHGKYHFVIARTEAPRPGSEGDSLAGLNGLSLFLVPAYTEENGKRVRLATVDRVEEKLGGHGSATCSVNFDKTPAQLIGERGEGFKQMLLLMNGARVGVGFEALGLCEAAYRLASAYAAERKSMGKPIARHEMIADYLDEMHTDIQGIRALAMAGAYHEEMSQRMRSALDLGLVDPDSIDGGKLKKDLAFHRKRARRATPLLKYIAAEKAVEMARRAIQILGGAGYVREYGAEKLLRDAIVMPIYEGTSQIQSLMAMKDTLTGILRNPQGFVTRIAQARWRSLSARDPLERKVARIQLSSLSAQQHLVSRTASDKLRAIAQEPVGRWPNAIRRNWDPKRDFAFAMLHAERLTRLLADSMISTILLDQAVRHPERREVAERWAERAEHRARSLHEEITTTGERLLEQLDASDPSGASGEGSGRKGA